MIDERNNIFYASNVPTDEGEGMESVLNLKDHVTPAGYRPLETLLDRLSRARPLQEDESRLLGYVIGSQKKRDRAGECRFKWNYALDTELAASFKKTGSHSAFAEKHGITVNAAYIRYYKKVRSNG